LPPDPTPPEDPPDPNPPEDPPEDLETAGDIAKRGASVDLQRKVADLESLLEDERERRSKIERKITSLKRAPSTTGRRSLLDDATAWWEGSEDE
jgi:hypothetical protein